MLTRSNIYEDFAERQGIQTETIVKITIGSNEYFFSHRPMPKGLNTNPIYPILLNCGDIDESIDIYSKSLKYGSVSITLSDLPFYPSSGETPIKASELLTKINGATLDIYFMAGDKTTDIDDCLSVFSGYVLTQPELESEQIRIEAENKIKIEDVVVPPRVIEDEMSGEFKNTPIPLVYGYFHLGTEKTWLPEYLLDYPGTGLVKGYPTSNARFSPYIVSDGGLSIYEAFFNLGGPTVVYVSHIVQSTSPSGLLLVRPDAIEDICKLVFPVAGTSLVGSTAGALPGIYDDETYEAENPKNAVNLGDSKVATLRDNYIDNTTTMYGLGLWAFAHPELFAQHVGSCRVMKAFYTSIVAKAGVTIAGMSAWLYYGREDATDEKTRIGLATTSISYVAGIHEIDNEGKNGDDITSSLNEIYVPGIEIYSNSNEGNGSTDDQDMLDIDRFHVELYWSLTSRPNEIWCTAKGERYGAWITASGRANPGGFGSGQTIQHMVYIIESLYRIQYGLGDDDIDTASFDNCYEETLEGRINITEAKPMSDYIRQLSEQSTFAICHSSTGKLRAVKLNEPSPTTIATIERHHLINDEMKVVKLSRIINSLTIHSNWHAQYNKFLDRDSYEDSDSIDQFRTREAEYKWENISGDAAEHVAEAYVNSADGLWSKEHIQASFSTFGLMHSHLEVGDWIALSTDLDELRAPFGGTWQGKSLLITKIKKADTSTEITAVEIIAFEYSPEPSASPEPSPSPVEDGLWLLDDDTDPANSTLSTGYTALLDGIYNAVACRPFTAGPSVGIDMGEQATLSSLRLYDTGYSGQSGLKVGAQLKLYISNDNANWSYIETFTPLTRTATGGASDPYYIDVVFSSDQTARYFKLFSPGEPLKDSGNHNLDLSEIEPTEASPSPSP
jgi:hypothetical protein